MIAEKIFKTQNYSPEEKEVIQYGMIAIVQIVITLFLVTVLGLLLHVAVEALLITFSVSILRKYSGGSHASSIELCTATAVIYSVGCGMLCKWVLTPIMSYNLLIVLTSAVFLWVYFIIYYRAPVDSPNKPIQSESKIKRMRNGSFLIVTIYFLLCTILIALSANNGRFYGETLSILFGALWQTATLTKVSAYITKKFSFHNNDI